MFKDGAVEGRVDADVYGEEAEDFTQGTRFGEPRKDRTGADGL